MIRREWMSTTRGTIPKPDELVALYGVTTELFVVLKRWFGVPDAVQLDLSNIDAATTEMADPVMIAALAMRKLQALHLVATPGVKTTTDVVVSVVQDLDRALVQAPNMRLRLAAATPTGTPPSASCEAAGEDARRAPPRPTTKTPRPATSASSTACCTPPSTRWSRPPTARSASSS